MTIPPLENPEVAGVFASYPPNIRPQLLVLRELIFTVAATTEGVGELEETLKWGEPAYVTAQSKSGSTLRIHWKKSSPSHYGMYFHCQTRLVDTFRTLFPTTFKFEGNRAIIFGEQDQLAPEELAICIEMALTYHRKKPLKI